ncbi:MAG: hypothetical protein K2I49_01715, partial [Ureaplasma sp.]|nr:hypothetical protein [Ureaplasma sp.]
MNNLKLDVKLLVRNIVKKDNEITFRSYDKTIYQLNEYVFNKDSGFPTPIENTVKRSYKTGYDKKAMDEALDKYPLDLSEAGNYYSDHSSNGDSVRLNYLEGHADDIYKWGYDFDTYITFPDVKISELNQFDTFLSYDNLFKSSYCTVDERTTQVGPGTGSGNIAQVIRINNFRGASFNLKLFFPNGCYSTAFSDAKGTDFKIFGFGTHSKGLENFDLTATFDVIVSKAKSSKVTKNDMINYIENKLSEKYMLSYDDNSNEKIINNFLFEQIKDLIWSLFKNNPDYFWNNISKFLNDDNFSLLYTPSDPQFKMVELKVNEDENFSLKPNFALLNAENTLWFNFKKTNNFLKFGKVSSPDSKDANELLDGITINYDNICNTKIDNSTNSTLN